MCSAPTFHSPKPLPSGPANQAIARDSNLHIIRSTPVSQRGTLADLLFCSRNRDPRVLPYPDKLSRQDVPVASMGSFRRHCPLRTIISVLAALLVFVYWTQHQPAPITMPEDTLSRLVVSVRHSGSYSLTFSVTNKHDAPLTVLKWQSPFDPSAVHQGVLKLYSPADSDMPLDIPIVQIRRRMPPGRDALVTIEPGQTAEHQVELKEPVVPIDKLKGDVKISGQGRWLSVWQKRADEVSAKELEDLGGGDQTLTGDYVIEPVTVTF
ncbi:hypothetical protein JX265_004931 [Neoarthrinium moseri]|uniref:Uncharacterized protein n=1 Tax=Neoarthrinium moseri TaxID=1658444 RepID=A0A9P9WQD4_9PEZI|nr:uncharacterized protein JN550_011866 [Neoarthrinium moseri]KAI1850875.1 hypothetical protein JX266_003540 [Neoarthrinium moseri]KAI1859671.1 hypothetical protein JN550_011866 [Neoarthrinium moseri]KAI1874723.1 hypothetical protein JX265_004931 [Neoarthrinium moseri]